MLLFNGYHYCFCCSCKHSLIAYYLNAKKRNNIFRFLRNLNLWCLYWRWLMLPHHLDLKKYISCHLYESQHISTQQWNTWPSSSFKSSWGKAWSYIVLNYKPAKHLQSFLRWWSDLNVKHAVCVSTAENPCLCSKVESWSHVYVETNCVTWNYDGLGKVLELFK